MIRKSLIALTAVAAVAAAALIPTSSASAHPSHFKHFDHFNHFNHFHRGFGWRGPAFVGGAILTGAAIAATESCYAPQVIETPRGPRQVWLNVC